ncbi:AraC family transcriptional regulator [soil metagenome]
MSQTSHAVPSEPPKDEPPVNPLAELIARHAHAEGVQPSPVPSLYLYRAGRVAEPVHTLYKPSLCFIAQGRKVVTLEDEVLRYDPEHFLLVAVNLPITSQILVASPDKPHLALHIELDLGLIADLMSNLEPRAVNLSNQSGLSVGVLEPVLRDAVVRLARLLDTPEHIPTLAPLTLREIGYILLCSPQGAKLWEMALTNGPSYRIATAIQQLVASFDQTLEVEQLAAEVNMSVSSFYQHFKSVTKMTPVQFQKRLRLQEARRLLLARESDVTGTSFKVGYESPSQFSREYKRLFGVPPSQDVDRFRDSSFSHESFSGNA